MSSKVSSWSGSMKISRYEHTLDSFELKCPPRDEEKVVLYCTSLRGIRKTYEDCGELRLILQGFGVHVDERDVWMHSKFRDELSELLESKRVQVPRLFIKGSGSCRILDTMDQTMRCDKCNENGLIMCPLCS
ncbi:hypothetical protein L7F22_026015 [Adiantum nelumboides]|nr:hypothetical protein [Adiantum nelumboides]